MRVVIPESLQYEILMKIHDGLKGGLSVPQYVTCHFTNAFSLSPLHSKSLSYQHYSLGVALHTAELKYMPMWTLNLPEIFECTHVKISVSGQFKQAMHTHVTMKCGAHSGSPQ